ncbi:hypothetical protein SD81_016510 [Tolypothrix campylonemoides VB511288]|nr:hypothetical protein SD81_016510 [Tolypothrix campylonemoides VB511288]
MRRATLALLVLAWAGAAQAQDPSACPRLPAESGLTWEHRGTAGNDLCRALRADGSEAFGMYISRSPAFKPKGGNREEAGVLDGREISWYRAEIAGRPGVEARETLVTLPDGRVAHIWLQAPRDALRESLGMAQSVQFGDLRFTQN